MHSELSIKYPAYNDRILEKEEIYLLHSLKLLSL